MNDKFGLKSLTEKLNKMDGPLSPAEIEALAGDEPEYLGHHPVERPAHYTSGPIHSACGEPIECIDIVQHMDFCFGNVFKYIWRTVFGDGTKGGLQCLHKAGWYLARGTRLWEDDHR